MSIDPTTGDTFATHPALTDDALEARLAAANAGWTRWRTSPVGERVALLNAIADILERDRRDLGAVAVREMGKPIAAAVAEVEKCVAALRYYAKDGPAMLEPFDIAVPNGRARGHWLPLGPVLAVMPWNFPYWQVIRFLAPAILAGNVGLLKHASQTQGVAGRIEDALREAGAPDGVFANLPVEAKRVAGIIADDRIAAATLTGSEGAGAKVAEAAGSALKKVVLELGGSDPFIVLPSADIDKAARIAAKARMQNAGQSCVCAKRMIVHRDVYDAFKDRFVAAVEAVRVGDPMADDTDMGPLSSIAQRDTVVDQVARAKAAGATLLTGGEAIDRPGAWMTPGILADVPRDADIAREEIFGPVAMLFRADDLDDAIALANATPFGLGSSVWTNDDAERDRLVRDVAAGMTAVNAMTASAPQAPFGGIGRSGHGRELGPWGMREFMNLKTVTG